MSKRSVRPSDRILQSIIFVRGQRVILDADLALLYVVKTKVLIQAVKRNLGRFPKDFMFQLSKREFGNLRSQIVTSSSWGGRRTPPFAFTEHGVAMLSSVLNSPRAVKTNIQIMRAFVELRRMIGDHHDLARRIDELEKRYDDSFRSVFKAIRKLVDRKEPPKPRIGYLEAGAPPHV